MSETITQPNLTKRTGAAVLNTIGRTVVPYVLPIAGAILPLAIAGVASIAIAQALFTSPAPYVGDRGENITAGPPIASVQDFINKIEVDVKKAKNGYPVPNSVSIAQAIYESGHGTSLLARKSNNLFGMSNGTGSPQLGSTNKGGRFKIYRNWEESIMDHAFYLGTKNPIDPKTVPHEGGDYKYAREHYANDPDNFVITIAPTYAPKRENKNYPENIIKIMKTYNLYQYDR